VFNIEEVNNKQKSDHIYDPYTKQGMFKVYNLEVFEFKDMEFLQQQ